MSRYLTDAIVEDAASMAFENSMRFYGARWPEQGESIKEAWRRSMRTLLGRVAEQIGAEVAKDLGPRPPDPGDHHQPARGGARAHRASLPSMRIPAMTQRMTAAEWIAKRRREHAEAWDRSDMVAAYDALPKALDALEALLKGHRPVSFSFSWRDGVTMHEVCETCQDKAGVHPCGCWRDEDMPHVCAVCSDPEHRMDAPYPCMTVQAIATALGVKP